MDDRHGYYFEDLSPGMSAVFSKTVTEADLLMFAGVSRIPTRYTWTKTSPAARCSRAGSRTAC